MPDFHRKFAGATDGSDAGNPQIKMPRQGEGGTLIGATLFYMDFRLLQGVQYNCNCAVLTKGIFLSNEI